MIAAKHALKITLTNVHSLKASRNSSDEVMGRCLAEDIRADGDLPPTDCSAMDGYAVRAKDLADGPRELRLVRKVTAGSSERPAVRAGDCVRILTGASIPPGSDAVVKLAETAKWGEVVRFLATITVGANIRTQGLQTHPIRSCGSADLVAGAQANGVLRVPQGVQRVSPGALVEFTPWRSIP